MTRQALFQIHWFLGITAGLVLALMGVTGAALSFEDEISEALTPHLFAPGVPHVPDISPDRMIARLEADHPGYYVSRLDWETDRDRSHSVRMNKIEGNGRLQGQADRATGAWLGEPAGAGFFHFVDGLHRWLALPGGGNGIGRQITAFSAIALIFFALSGLYLRWPRQALDWRSWFVLDLRKTGRNLWRVLHVVVGTWVLLFYLLSALTGLWWSYDWYRQGVIYALTGKTAEREGGRKSKSGAAARAPIDPAWNAFRRETGASYVWVRITQPKPGTPAKAISFDALPADARHLRQTDRFSYDTQTASRTKRDLYDRRPIGTIITQSMFELHRGAFFGLPGRIIMLLTSMTMPLFTITGYLLYLSRRKRKRATSASEAGWTDPTDADLVIAYGSQTGSAELHARNAAIAFSRGGTPARLVPLSRLTPDMLSGARKALFVVSTYGEGEPPDMARGFVRRSMGNPADLQHLDYGVLALGDREYPDFCAFGMTMDAWLARSGARALFPMIAMDHEDAQAEAAWHGALQQMGATDAARGQRSIAFTGWTLAARNALNPDSAHAPAFHIRLEPAGDVMPEWAAGDIAEIQSRNDPAQVQALLTGWGMDGDALSGSRTLRDHLAAVILPDGDAPAPNADVIAALRPLPAREYSAASVPADGTLDLFIRQVTGPDGRLGIGSGWLTAHSGIGATLSIRLRPNPGFRVDDGAAPLILIGNGTGIAGLRAHLSAQAHAGRGGHWLLFGERSRTHEAFFDAQLQAWKEDGTLARIDRSFSRDADCGRYVQDLVAGAEDEIRAWLDNGAVILVCGSLEGMASGVHDALSAIVGSEALDQLAEFGRYKRDVY